MKEKLRGEVADSLVTRRYIPVRPVLCTLRALWFVVFNKFRGEVVGAGK